MHDKLDEDGGAPVASCAHLRRGSRADLSTWPGTGKAPRRGERILTQSEDSSSLHKAHLEALLSVSPLPGGSLQAVFLLLAVLKKRLCMNAASRVSRVTANAPLQGIWKKRREFQETLFCPTCCLSLLCSLSLGQSHSTPVSPAGVNTQMHKAHAK